MYTMRERKNLKKLGPGECTKSECVGDFSSSESSCRIAIVLGLILPCNIHSSFKQVDSGVRIA